MKTWFENRSGLIGALRKFLAEPIPKSVGWRQTLGSTAGALVLIQMLTGVLLALYYSPHPDGAYASIEYIEKSVLAGGFVRALHYWGASFILVVLLLHTARVFFMGAYKKPRELTWVVGVCLFGLMCGLAFTGQLLPWNQDGYWAAKIGVEITSSAPLIGPLVKKLILGGESLGVLTLTRFYALHVVVLPFLLGLLILFHLHLLRRHGPMRPARDLSADTEAFSPLQLARDLTMISLVFIAWGLTAYIYGGPNSGPADPADASHFPRPEWYFLSHFEVLRVTPGSMKVLATFYLPALVALFLFALPWLDRGKTTALRDRRLPVAAGSLLLVSVIALTVSGILTSPESQSQEDPLAETPTSDDELAQAGRRIFRRLKCLECHKIRGRGKTVGPDLSRVGLRLQENYIRQWLRDPQSIKPEVGMEPVRIADTDFNKLVAYLMSLNDETGR